MQLRVNAEPIQPPRQARAGASLDSRPQVPQTLASTELIDAKVVLSRCHVPEILASIELIDAKVVLS